MGLEDTVPSFRDLGSIWEAGTSAVHALSIASSSRHGPLMPEAVEYLLPLLRRPAHPSSPLPLWTCQASTPQFYLLSTRLNSYVKAASTFHPSPGALQRFAPPSVIGTRSTQ